MNPFLLVALGAMIFGGGSARTSGGVARAPLRWEPTRATDIAKALIAKGETDERRLCLALAKALYPIDPSSGRPLRWPPPKNDAVTGIIWGRIQLRVRSLLAAVEEEKTDELLAADEPAKPAVGIGKAAMVSDMESAVAAAMRGETFRPRLTLPKPPPVNGMTLPRPPTPTKPSRYRLRPGGPPQTGTFHTLAAGESLLGQGSVPERALQNTLHAAGIDPRVAVGLTANARMIEQYRALIVTAPTNGEVSQTWNHELEQPSIASDPAAGTEIWLPAVNIDHLLEGTATTAGVTWPDGSSGIQPPPPEFCE